MHVELRGLEAMVGKGVALEGLDEDGLAAGKAARRALLAERLEQIWLACEPFIDAGVSSGAEVRMLEVALRVVDRQLELFEVLRADRPGSVSEVVVVGSGERRAAVLALLEGVGG